MTAEDYRYAPPPPSPPRREELISSALVLASRVSPEPAAPEPKAMAPVRSYPDTAIPSGRALVMMSRFAWGHSRKTAAAIRKAGGPDAWFEKQLSPNQVSDHDGELFDGWYPDRMKSAKAKWDAVFAGRKGSWEYAVDLANWSLLRRSRSTRQVHEVMTDFWSNHFHVPSTHDLAWSWRNQYDGTIRRLALSSFEDLLLATSLHPAMLLYLSNYESTKYAPNENQGRELLELHTVGRDAGYTEAMVKSSAKILTGYTVNAWKNWLPRYDKSIHYQGVVRVLDFESQNRKTDGRAVAREYLKYLANHPATARRIATKLAVRFVSDNPSSGLVDELAATFTSSGTSIKATLRALVAHPEFEASAGLKVRNPIEDFVATVRTLGIDAKKPHGSWPFAEAQIWMCRGQYPFMWPRPDGMPLDNDSWSSASQVLGSLDLHYSLSGGWVGDRGSAHYRTPESWLPQKQIRFDAFVDHLSRTLLARESTPKVLHAACQATGVDPAEKINKNHAIVQWLMPRLLTAILDTPAHMAR